jgi:hypothetical protein
VIDGVAVLRDLSGRICFVLFDGDGEAVAMSPLSDQAARDLRDGLSAVLGNG